MIPRYLVNFESEKLQKNYSDLLVIGSGIAGLTAAMQFCKEYRVTLITKSKLKESSTWYAQGGVATVVSEEDSIELHLEDTLQAGAGLCDPRAVQVLVSEGPKSIFELINLGVGFDRALGGEIELSREGGHSLPRILHSGDSTGSELEKTLIEAVKTCPDIIIKKNTFVLDLITHKGRCIGAIILPPDSKEPVLYFARAVILATGGLGQVFGVTTNPPISTGDGISMAFRAGAEVCDMEFIQFHPTALDISESPRFLITEALRGVGAYLRDCSGERFMVGAHPQAELAPRYIVVKEMLKAMDRCNDTHVYLDATHLSRSQLKKEFPNIYEHCYQFGYDLTKDLVPVSPAAHYIMGGIKTDTYGRTNIPGLYASGEVACTGVHGANRLASNSLLEGLVFSRRIKDKTDEDFNSVSKADLEKVKINFETKRTKAKVDVEKERKLLSELMFKNAGVKRSKASLEEVFDVINKMGKVLKTEFHSTQGFELQNIIIAAYLIVKSALMREESRGTHFREDFPSSDDENWKKHTILKIKGK